MNDGDEEEEQRVLGDKLETPKARSGIIDISCGMRYRPELRRGGGEMKEKRVEEG
jgi:hypothetical protein